MLQIRENVKDFRTGPSGPMHDDTSTIGPMQAHASKNLSSILINPCKHRGLRCEKNLWISIASLPWASRSGPCACSCPNVERADDVGPPLTGNRAIRGVLIQKTDRQAQERARVRIGPVRIGCVQRNNPRSMAKRVRPPRLDKRSRCKLQPMPWPMASPADAMPASPDVCPCIDTEGAEQKA